MNKAEPDKNQGKPRILIAPLDWGLGHATRCILLINELLAGGADVWLAGDGAREELLKQEFPSLPFLPLAGYRVQYARSAAGLVWKMARQTPRLLKAIKREHQWLKDAVHQYGFAAVISDNRYGLHHPGITSIFITHQLRIKTPLPGFIENWLQQKNYHYINRFSACWVPDSPLAGGLAGELSHPHHKPSVPVEYIGPLSRFSRKEVVPEKHRLLIILSGPEPQRTLFESILLKEIQEYDGNICFVRGLPGEANEIPATEKVTFYNHLSAARLNDEMLKAEYVIGRSGYSTVMDLAALQKKSILIPTPGQTEQEYLGRYLFENKKAITVQQHRFCLQSALAEAAAFPYNLPEPPSASVLKEAVTRLLNSLRK
ncbi:MAG: glycosyl transferase family 28 [Chitinophagaceae bacterium]|nr:glycosyl transferase family 28 [Chitinophagaceae bacterium]